MSLPRYPAYKVSGVAWLGEIPDSWNIVPFYSIAKERDESNKGMVEDNLLSLSYGKIVRKDLLSNDGLLPESFETYQIVRAGDIVFRLTDLQNDKRSLRTAIVKEVGIITSAYLAAHFFAANSHFYNYQLRAYDLMKVFYSMGGGLRQSMKFSDIKRIPLLLPSLQEQTLITQFLDRETTKIDDLIAEQEKLITLLDEKRQAMISLAVTKGLNLDVPMKDSGVEWLGEVPEHWSVCQFRRVISKIEQGWSPECESRPAEALEWGVLKSGCVNGGIFNTEENKALPSQLTPIPEYEVHIDDLLMSRASGSPKLIGSIALVKKVNARLMLSDKIFRLHLMQNKLMKNYMSWLGRSTSFRLQIEGAISGAEGLANNLPQSSIKKFWIVFPSLSEQSEIVTFLDVKTTQLDNLKAEAQRGIDLLKERRSALISAAVTGKIDVRGLTNTEAA